MSFYSTTCQPSLRIRRKSREEGQSTLEALLFLSLAAIISLGLVAQFHAGFSQYAKDLFSGYFACLLETGELPGNNEEGLCEPPGFSWSPNTAAVSNNPRGSASSSRNISRSSADRKSANRSSSTKKTSSRSGSRGQRASARSRTTGRLSNNESSGVARSNQGRPRTFAAKRAGGKQSGNSKALPNNAKASKGNTTDKKVRGGRKRLVGISKEDRTPRNNLSPRANTLAHRDQAGRVRRIPANLDKNSGKKIDTNQGDASWFNFGNMLRYAVIIGILILILLLLGGQALQIKKGLEAQK